MALSRLTWSAPGARTESSIAGVTRRTSLYWSSLDGLCGGQYFFGVLNRNPARILDAERTQLLRPFCTRQNGNNPTDVTSFFAFFFLRLPTTSCPAPLAFPQAKYHLMDACVCLHLHITFLAPTITHLRRLRRENTLPLGNGLLSASSAR